MDRRVAVRRHRLRRAAGDGSTATFDLGDHPDALVMPVVDLRRGSTAVTTLRAPAAAARLGARRARSAPQGDSPAPGALLPVTLGATLPAADDRDGHDHGHRWRRARLDAVMVQPLVSRLVLGGDGHGTALLRSAATSDHAHDRRRARHRDAPQVWSYDGHGRLLVTHDQHRRRRTRDRRRPAASPSSVADRRPPPPTKRDHHDHTPHAEFPLGPFTPYAENPILRPQGDGWESGSVYNPAAVVKDDKVVLLYRAHADDIVSHVGLATSDDGIHFERHPEPVLSPSEDYERSAARTRGSPRSTAPTT